VEVVGTGPNLGEDAGFIYEERSDGTYEVLATVLESETQSPMICTGVSTSSLPPLCGDVELANWDWERVTEEQEEGGSTWGTFHFLGELAGGRFTVTQMLD
jgi:hypothetical protein